MVVVLAVGAADQLGRHAGDGLHLVVAGGDVGHDLLGGEGIVVVVVVGVVHDLHAGVVERLHGLGILIHPVAHQKERGLHVVFGQNVNEHLGVFVAPRCVEGNGAVFFAVLTGAVYAVDGQLAGASGGGDGGGDVHGAENGHGGQQSAGGQGNVFSDEEHTDGLLRHRDSTFLFFATLCAVRRGYAAYTQTAHTPNGIGVWAAFLLGGSVDAGASAAGSIVGMLGLQHPFIGLTNQPAQADGLFADGKTVGYAVALGSQAGGDLLHAHAAGLLLCIRRKHNEFVLADAVYLAVGKLLSQLVGHHAEHPVAGLVAALVIDLVQAVCVDIDAYC